MESAHDGNKVVQKAKQPNERTNEWKKMKSQHEKKIKEKYVGK